MTYPVASFMAPSYATNIKAHLDRMVVKAATRDSNHSLIHGVRRGHIRQLFPSELDFSISFNGSPIANFVDIVAHDMAEGIAPLPALECVTGKMETDADQKRAEVKNGIGGNYWKHSKLEMQMLKQGADWYVTYGFVALMVEPDPATYLPRVMVIDPRKSYYELDRYGNTNVFAHKWLRTIDDLCAMFPEYASQIRKDPKGYQESSGETQLDYVLWVDKGQVCLLLPQRDGLVLSSYQHRMSRCPVVIAERP